MEETRIIQSGDHMLTLMHYTEPLLEIEKGNGIGYYGCLLGTTDGEKVQCAICGELYETLSSHIAKKHGIKSREYKEKFKLSLTTSLISEKVRARLQMSTQKWAEEQEKKFGKDWRDKYEEARIEGVRNRKNKGRPRNSLEYQNKLGICPDQLIAKIHDVEKELGYTPSKDDFIRVTGTQRFVHLITRTFGSWSQALEKADLQPKENHTNSEKGGRRYTREELIKHLKNFYEINKKIPTESDSRRGFIPPANTYRNHFGSLPAARELAGIKQSRN